MAKCLDVMLVAGPEWLGLVVMSGNRVKCELTLWISLSICEAISHWQSQLARWRAQCNPSGKGHSTLQYYLELSLKLLAMFGWGFEIVIFCLYIYVFCA